MAEPVLTPADTLIGYRNTDRGWGYAPAKASRLEPTCWSLLALSGSRGQPIDVDILLKWKRQDGWLIDVPGAPVNFAFNALAALTLCAHPQGLSEARRIGAGLLDIRGVKFAQGREMRQDNSLQAWPWIGSTFSWVEPTSLCVLLLKKLRADLPAAAVNDRLDIGERMLLDRACAAGGWNYGGSNVYGQELFPYVPTTALGLLAMQDRRKHPTVARALAWIQENVNTEPSGHALALTFIALAAYRIAAPALQQSLRKHLEANAGRLGVLGLATGVYALSRSPNGESAFSL